MVRTRLAPVVLVFAALAAACGDDGNGATPSPLPSGSLGPVAQEAADEAVLGLCELAGATDRGSAEAVFLDRSHQTLHVIAAATLEVDPVAAGELLVAKQVVEADLAEGELPPTFDGDVEALRSATRSALEAIGLDAPDCEP